CCTSLVMSEEGRLGLSGPEVIETARGVEEFDARDRALVWRTVGGKHRYLIGDCQRLVDDLASAFRAALADAIRGKDRVDSRALEDEQAMLSTRLARFGGCEDALDIWRLLGAPDPEAIPLSPTHELVAMAAGRRIS
ncbi:MAG TPA: hypothetical protein VMS45_06825, partial [Gemmatimonadaceae bacterium]|nr:hypothetical protein [Gemmatimonadaceae bacterium]